MKKCLATILIVALTAILCVALFACNEQTATHAINYDEVGYEAKESFEAENIEALDIDWLAGEVHLSVDQNAQNVRLYERAAENRGDALTMRLLVSDGTLFVKCAAPGSYTLDGNMLKILYVTVPSDMCLESVRIRGIGETVSLKDVMVRHTEVETRSGSVKMDTAAVNFASYPRYISLSTLSGNISLNVTSNVIPDDDESGGVVKASTSSGGVDIKINGSVPLLQVKTTSGYQKLELNKPVMELNADTLSGLIELTARTAPLKMIMAADISVMNFKLNREDAFELVTDAKLAVSVVDISKGEDVGDGNFKYVYEPSGYQGDFRSQYTVSGKGAALNLELMRVA